MADKKKLISDFFKKKSQPADVPTLSLKRSADGVINKEGSDDKRLKSEASSQGWSDVVPKSVWAKQYGNVASKKIAAFDMDGTRIKSIFQYFKLHKFKIFDSIEIF